MIDLEAIFAHVVLCAPGWSDTALDALREAGGPRLCRVVEHPAVRPGEVHVLCPSLEPIWAPFA